MATIVLAGGFDAPKIYRVDEGATDDGQAVVARLQSTPLAPAGAGGEAVFTAVYLVATLEGQGTIWLTPIVDGTEYTEQAISFDFPTRQEAATYEIGLSRPLVSGGAERARFALRGTWFALKVKAQLVSTSGTIILEGVEVEHAVVQETRTPVP
ncbi:MAG: hypothetical protein ONB52_21920 [candidate division KSB1 bacterium]|nr:hypothetical protein [candidate division KSB1 bacterium]